MYWGNGWHVLKTGSACCIRIWSSRVTGQCCQEPLVLIRHILQKYVCKFEFCLCLGLRWHPNKGTIVLVMTCSVSQQGELNMSLSFGSGNGLSIMWELTTFTDFILLSRWACIFHTGIWYECPAAWAWGKYWKLTSAHGTTTTFLFYWNTARVLLLWALNEIYLHLALSLL